MKRWAMGVALCIACSSVIATDDRWVEMTTTGNGAETIYLDGNSMRRTADGATAWRKIVLRSPEVNSAGKRYKTLLQRDSYNCANETVGILNAIWHDEDGSVVGSVATDVPALDPVAPGTVNEALLNAVCAVMANTAAVEAEKKRAAADAAEAAADAAIEAAEKAASGSF